MILPLRIRGWVGVITLLLAGCHPAVPDGSLLLTETPVDTSSTSAVTVLDVRYPWGSRVVLLEPPFREDAVRELSRGLVAAGDPRVSWDGRWVYFVGKGSERADWQIYKVAAAGGSPEQVTHVTGGAMNPALAAHDELVFSSPVPKANELWSAAQPPALYEETSDATVRRLTFGPDGAIDATVLRDGRIMFVTVQPRDQRRGTPRLSLFTINNDGTEISAYGAEQDGAALIRRPRELGDGRIAYLAGRQQTPGPMDWAECVRTAAPFTTRARLFDFKSGACRSAEPLPGGDLLVCVETHSAMARMRAGNSAVYRLAPNATSVGPPLFESPRWNSIEATLVSPQAEPAGHTTAVMPTSTRGTALCLDVNYSSSPSAGGVAKPAASLRAFTIDESGKARVLGTAPVAEDGSVLAYLPVQVPLGFETLDAGGNVLRHQPAFVSLQPGENRACVGCHEPRNHSPRNVRPLAVMREPAHLELAVQTSTARAANP